jgi:DNA segregation ATPase FtsK/SpoIIIE, S-DNA-T family
MQIVYVAGDARRELDVRVNNPAAAVADLVRALDPTAGDDSTLLIGDRPADPDLELAESGLHEGATVRLGYAAATLGLERAAAASTTPVTPAGSPELVVVSGLDAGRRFPLAPGTAVLGRASGCDIELDHPTVSKRHAELMVGVAGDVTVADLGSHNGTWVGGLPVVKPVPLDDGMPVRLGALELELRPVEDRDRPIAVDPVRHANAAGTIPFNRPPRPAPPAPPADLAPPALPRTGQGKVPLSLIAILTPLIFAGVMFAVTRSPQFLMFGLLTPVIGIGNAVDAKRRGRRSDRRESERFRRELGEFRGRLAALAADERRRLQSAYPDPAEIMRRVELPSTTLWERRPAHPDFLRLRAGVGDVPWAPPVVRSGLRADAPAELTAALAESEVVRGAPVPVDLAAGGVVGIVGDRDAALSLARSLVCQAAALHGPADLPVMILSSADAAPAWDWSKWLPHTRDAGGIGRMLSQQPELSTRLVEGHLGPAGRDRADRAERAAGPTLLVVVDDESLTEGRKAPTRGLLRGEGGLVAGIVIASTVDRLPAVCTTVVEMTDPDGRADLTLPQRGRRIADFLAGGMADDVARDCARSLARFEDPELDLVGAGLPASIRLLPLLDLEDCTPDAVLARWKAGGIDPPLATPIGVAENGVFGIDFVADGPHGLVGGTTGAGKSELLRTLVAGLAASVDPDRLTLVLVDFKGGSAFDECALLPHTVGMVTDLDQHLAERALRCLEAELRHRERVLRDAGAVDLPDYRRKGLPQPLPRLLVIIDEFATLKAELPDFIDALVGVAQRGRSLGVHLLLATQRPQGAISDNIRANTNLRIALRVQERTDSTDVIDVPDAAGIPRTAPGRAYVRLGPGEVVAIQTALSTGSRQEAALAPVDVAPFVYGPAPRPVNAPAPPDLAASPVGGGQADADAATAGDTDLSLLVAAIGEAFARTGRPRPRRPWPDPLPDEVDLDRLIDRALQDAGARHPLGFVPLALADDPEAQTQYPMGWSIADGNLIVYGIGGSGTTTTLSSLALSLARLHSPDDVHIYALDFAAGELGALAPLPHVGAVIMANEGERQTRLVRHLRAELDRRRQLGVRAPEQGARGPSGPATEWPRADSVSALHDEPRIVTLVDGWSAFAAEYNDLAGGAVYDAFGRVFADGPDLRMYTVVAADRAAAVPGQLASLVRQRLALRLADAHDYAGFGVRSTAVPEMVPGRALVAGTGQVVQVARPAGGLAAAAARLAETATAETAVASTAAGSTAAASAAAARRPEPIASLATAVKLAELAAPARLGERPWSIPIGVAERTLSAAGLVVYEGEHALIAGPARSGKSTGLLTVAAACRASRPAASVIAVAGPRSPLAGEASIDEVVAPAAVGDKLLALVERARDVGRLVLVLVDDAESLDDSGGALERLSTSDLPGVLLVAAGRNDGIRTGYSHWTRPLRRSKLGVLLRPDVDLDGDILGASLPRRAPVAMVPGRGYVVNSGEAELIQVALPG